MPYCIYSLQLFCQLYPPSLPIPFHPFCDQYNVIKAAGDSEY